MSFDRVGQQIVGRPFPEEASVSLLNKTASVQKRDELNGRRLYTPESPYDVEARGILGQTLNSINEVANLIFPAGSVDLRNTILGRNLEPVTPLVRIANAKLLQEFKNRLVSGFQREKVSEFIPDINILNVFDSNPKTTLLTKNYNYQITVRNREQRQANLLQRFGTNILGFLEDITAFQFDNPLEDDLQVSSRAGTRKLLENTGVNVIRLIQTSAAKSVYNPFVKYVSTDSFFKLPIVYWTDRRFENESIEEKRDYIGVLDDSGVLLRDNLQNEEAFNTESVTDIPHINDGKSIERLIDLGEFGNSFVTLDQETTREIIWGQNDADGIRDNFKVKRGLLYYTNEIVNKTKLGKRINQSTRNFNTLNDTPLPDIEDNDLKNNRGNFSCRIWTKTNQYDEVTKAIRFRGNGNLYSPINSSLIPRVAPKIDEVTAVNRFREVMFSIENLAYDKQDLVKLGLKDTCEEGIYGGRIMWFPPYDLQIAESVNVNTNKDDFIGRGESLYTYNNTERSLSLSFMLIMDYPNILDGQLRNRESLEIAKWFACGTIDDPANIAGDDPFGDQNLDNDPQFATLKKFIEPPVLKFKTKFYFQNDVPVLTNDWFNRFEILSDPTLKITEFNAIIDNFKSYSLNTTLYGRTFKRNGFKQEVQGTNYNFSPYPQNDNRFPEALNDKYYDYYWGKAGLSRSNYVGATTPIDLTNAPQVEYVLAEDNYDRNSGQNNSSFIDNVDYDINLIISTFDSLTQASGSTNASTSESYLPSDFTLFFTGYASKLSFDRYNIGLGYRRALALYKEFTRLFRAKTGKSLEEYGFNVRLASMGERQAKARIGDQDRNAEDPNVKKDRSSVLTVQFTGAAKYRDELVDRSKVTTLPPLGTNDKIEFPPVAGRQIRKICGFDERPQDLLVTTLKDKSKYYKQAFHSQTPEDFHRRMTFLHQITRQGRALSLTSGNATAANSVFGRQPYIILNIGDLYKSKAIVSNINFDLNVDGAPIWDLNPEGMGVQPMACRVSMSLTLIGGQSMETDIEKLQNAVSFNFYKNSTYLLDDNFSNIYQEANDGVIFQLGKNKDESRKKIIEQELQRNKKDRGS